MTIAPLRLLRDRTGMIIVTLSGVALLAFALLAPQIGLADNGWIATIVGGLLSFFVYLLSKILIMLISLLVLIAQYNDFVNSPAIANGWVIVRDVANMFFIIALLVIAFGTILNVQEYSYEKALPRLVIFAVLINFSRSIAGLFIDASQVIMLTFVNGFAQAAGGNFATMFAIRELMQVDPNAAASSTSDWAYVGGHALAVIMMLVAIVTILVMLAILAFRIVMLWALVVLSPLPYLLKVFPGRRMQQYGQKWWDEFFNYLIVGPVLAFFIWLALVSAGAGNAGKHINASAKVGGSDSEKKAIGEAIGVTKASQPDVAMSFIISISMLLAGLKVAGELGVAGSKLASGANQMMGKAAKGAAYKYTGARAVTERFGAVMAERKEARAVKVKASMKNIGRAQELAGSTLRNTVGLAGTAAGHAAGGKQAKKLRGDAAQLKRSAATMREAGNIDGAEAAEQRARTSQEEATRLEKRAGKWELGTNAAVTLVAGAATGGFAMAPVALSLAGKNIRDGGRRRVSKASNQRLKEVTKERDETKGMKAVDVLRRAEGGEGVTDVEQMGAMMSAIDNQYASPQDVARFRQQLPSLGADERTLNAFDASIATKYPGTIIPKSAEELKERDQRRPDATEADLARSDDERMEADLTEQRGFRKSSIESGAMDMRKLLPRELESAPDDAGSSLALEIAISGTSAQINDLTKDKAREKAFGVGLRRALASGQLSGEARSKVGAALMNTGGSFDEAFGMGAGQPPDLAGLASAVSGKGGGNVISAMTEADLANDDVRATVIRSADPAHLNQAMKSARDKGDGEKAAMIRGLIRDTIADLQAKTSSVGTARTRASQANSAATPVAQRLGIELTIENASQKVAELGGVDSALVPRRIAHTAAEGRVARLQASIQELPAGDPTRIRNEETLRDDAQPALDRARERLQEAQDAVTLRAFVETKQRLERIVDAHADDLDKLNRLKNPLGRDA